MAFSFAPSDLNLITALTVVLALTAPIVQEKFIVNLIKIVEYFVSEG